MHVCTQLSVAVGYYETKDDVYVTLVHQSKLFTYIFVYLLLIEVIALSF